MRKKIKNIFQIIADAIFPPYVTCICCNDELKNSKERENGICSSCYEEFTYIGDKNQQIDNKNLNINDFITVYAYEGKAKSLLVGFKDGNKPYLGKYIASFMYKEIKEKDMDFDYISYVPVSPKRKLLRTYDHMKIVADKLCEYSSIKVIDVLGRKDIGVDQTESKDRYKNIKGQFYYAGYQDLKGKHILLIDDVVTTGATISECAKLLREHKATKVSLLTFAEAKSFDDYKHTIQQRMQSHNK